MAGSTPVGELRNRSDWEYPSKRTEDQEWLEVPQKEDWGAGVVQSASGGGLRTRSSGKYFYEED